MVKDVSDSAVIDNFTIQEFYKYIYADAKAAKRYHLLESQDPNAEVTTWENGDRIVKFSMPIQMPQVIKNLIGADVISMIDYQNLKWSDAHSFVVTTRPEMQLKGPANFSSAAKIYVTECGSCNCKIDFTLTCEASVSWPLKGTFESFMAEQGKKKMGKWLDFLRVYLKERRDEDAATAALTKSQIQMDIPSRVSVEVPNDAPVEVQTPLTHEEHLLASSSGEDVAFWDANDDALLLDVPSALAYQRTQDLMLFGSKATLTDTFQSLQQTMAQTNGILLRLEQSLVRVETRLVAMEAAVQLTGPPTTNITLPSGAIWLSAAGIALAALSTSALVLVVYKKR